MKVLLSPAKSINLKKESRNPSPTLPIFLDKSDYLVNKLKKVSAKKIAKTMGVSHDIANLNYERYQDWHLPFTESNSKAAGDIFAGEVYRGLDFSSLSDQDRKTGQSTLRILSGLYGLLKPLDLIQPYRLEMGTRFAVTPKQKNLYIFWGDLLADALNEELENDESPFVVNLASSEYFKAAKLNQIKYPVITPIFKDKTKSGEYKVIMTFTKKARGLMSRYILQNNINSPENLKGFDTEGYSFEANASTDNEFIFIRG